MIRSAYLSTSLGVALLAAPLGCAQIGPVFSADSGPDEPVVEAGTAEDGGGEIDGAAPDAGVDTGVPDSGPDDDGGAVTAGFVECGDSTCDSESEICLGCDHDGSRDVHCVPRDGADIWAAGFSAASDHGCVFGPNLFIECDDSADCAADEECVFTGGEAGVGYCRPVREDLLYVSCSGPTDCSAEYPVCGFNDDFGYFAPYLEVLGWAPHTCHGVASLCTNLCGHPCSDNHGSCTANCSTDLLDCSTRELADLAACTERLECDFLDCARAVGCLDGGWGFF